MSDENINPDENAFDASNISDERKAELNRIAAELSEGMQTPKTDSPETEMEVILDDLRNRTGLSEDSHNILENENENENENDEPPEWASQSIPLPVDEDLPDLTDDYTTPPHVVTTPVDKDSNPEVTDIKDAQPTPLIDEEGEPAFDDDELDYTEVEENTVDSETLIGVESIIQDSDEDEVINPPKLDEALSQDEIIIDEDSFGQDFEGDDFTTPLGVEEVTIEDHAAENDFDVNVDENGEVIPESVMAESPDSPENTFNQQPLQQPPQQPAQQMVPMRAPLFGSLGSLFNRNKDEQNIDLSFNKHLERAASRDIEKLAGLQAEHTQLLTDTIKATNPASYNQDNEDNVLGLLKRLEQSAKVIDVQSERLAVTTSNMKEHGDSLSSNNSAFAKQTEQLNELLGQNASQIDSSNIKEAMSNLFKNIKDFINKALGRSTETSMDVN